MESVEWGRVDLSDGFWDGKLRLVREVSLPTQLQKYEENHTLANFRVAAGELAGTHRGWFYQDSDFYKWLEAATYFAGRDESGNLSRLVEEFVELLARAQAPDGYLNTYYQVLFPGTRWANPYFTHELYCAGHLLEAAVAHARVTGKRVFLDIARKFADLVVSDHASGKIPGPPGHPGVELGLVALYRITGERSYLDLAGDLVRERGVHWGFRKILGAALRFMKEQKGAREARAAAGGEGGAVQAGGGAGDPVSEDIHGALGKMSPGLFLRVAYAYATGRWALAHKPVARQKGPVGHAVRATYLYAAMADLVAETGNPEYMEVLESTWSRMVSRRMYVTGGIGALPFVEGFGRDYELPNRSAYAETCASIGNFLWNWRMLFLEPRRAPLHADLMERCLYNGILSGLGFDGRTYFYQNPLESAG
ncbi:MAG: glycoside hydrolase family 127 protein, partial [Promethearchaeota archaeon]